MKIAERAFEEDGKLIIQQTHDYSGILQQAKKLREAGCQDLGESKLVGRIPITLIREWCKEAGVKWSDVQARHDVVRRKLLSGEFDKFRVWNGRY